MDLPCFDVTGFTVDADSTCRYNTTVSHPCSGEWTFSVRWSQMETLVRDLHGVFVHMPEELNLPKYYFKTIDESKLEARRIQMQEFWDRMLQWLADDDPAAAAGLLGIKAMERFLHSVDHEFRGGPALSGPPPIGCGAEPEPEPAVRMGGGARPPRAPPPVVGGGRDGGYEAGSEPYFDEDRRTAPVPDDFELLRTLGKGSFGKVLLVRKHDGQHGGELFAMKILQKHKVVARNQI
jgi:hypothetical protein